jgi:hypothetical protein
MEEIAEITEIAAPEIEIPDDTHPEIIWGINQFSFPQPLRVGGNSTFAAGSVIDFFNSRLDTALSIRQYTFSSVNEYNAFDKEFAKMPDIFITDPMSVQGTTSVTYLNPQTVYDAGLTRTIPRAMLETYAPRYASLLTMHNAWEINQTAPLLILKSQRT